MEVEDNQSREVGLSQKFVVGLTSPKSMKLQGKLVHRK